MRVFIRTFKVEENYILPFISGIHAYIMTENRTVRIKDMGSKNGTFVNGVRLNEGEEVFLFVSTGR